MLKWMFSVTEKNKRYTVNKLFPHPYEKHIITGTYGTRKNQFYNPCYLTKII